MGQVKQLWGRCIPQEWTTTDVVYICWQIHPHIGTGMPDMVDLPNTTEHRTCSKIWSPPGNTDTYTECFWPPSITFKWLFFSQKMLQVTIFQNFAKMHIYPKRKEELRHFLSYRKIMDWTSWLLLYGWKVFVVLLLFYWLKERERERGGPRKKERTKKERKKEKKKQRIE